MPPDLATSLNRPAIPSIDGIRAIAVLLVVFYHFGIPLVNGGLGVLIFFVISGFLITWLLLQEEKRWGNVSLKLFYLRRTLRIFPAFYAYWGLVVIGIGVILGKRILWPQAWASFFYVNNYYQALFGDPNTGLSHTWSLAVEEQFYLLWPPVFILLARNQRRTVVLGIIIVTVWIHRIYLQLFAGGDQGYIYEALDTRADHLLIGCLLATLLHRGAWTRLWNALTAYSWSIWITLGMLAISSVIFAAPVYRDTVGFIIDPILAAALIVQAIAFAGSSARWLNWGAIAFLGRISYSIYLYQQIAMDPVKKLLASFPTPIRLTAAVGAVLVAASFSHFVIEKPFLKLKDRWGKRLKAKEIPIAASPVPLS
jgi:peptidoglycan/LPS O-acetylase OafA/YrhL